MLYESELDLDRKKVIDTFYFLNTLDTHNLRVTEYLSRSLKISLSSDVGQTFLYMTYNTIINFSLIYVQCLRFRHFIN